MREVEAQLVGAHRRAGLAHVRAEALAQGRVQQVGGGVVGTRSRGAPCRSTGAAPARPARSSPRSTCSATAWSSPRR